MKRVDILYLRFSLMVLAAVVISLSVLWLPGQAASVAADFPELAFLRYPVFVGILLTAAAFLWALAHAWRLLAMLDKADQASLTSLASFLQIRLAGFLIAVTYIGGMIFLASYNALHPGLLLVGVAVSLISLAVAAFATFLGSVLSAS